MTWAKVDDRANENVKQLKAGPAACWLWVCGLMYCNRQPKKDGRIPKEVLPLLFPTLGKRQANRLVAAGLWHDAGDCYQVHDYHGWNPELREIRAEAGRKGGQASSKARSNPEAKAKQVASDDEANERTSNEANAFARVGTDARRIHPTPPHPIEEPPKPPRGGTRGTRVPEDWEPSTSVRAFCEKSGLSERQLRLERDGFIDHWRGVPGKEGRKSDWDATFRNRIRSGIEKGRIVPERRDGAQPNPGAARPPQDHSDTLLAERARLARERKKRGASVAARQPPAQTSGASPAAPQDPGTQTALRIDPRPTTGTEPRGAA